MWLHGLVSLDASKYVWFTLGQAVRRVGCVQVSTSQGRCGLWVGDEEKSVNLIAWAIGNENRAEIGWSVCASAIRMVLR